MTDNEVAAGAWLALALYFLPTLDAAIRKHRHGVAITVLNLLSGSRPWHGCS
jgi:hypothetical protein